jgi:hypothetical protein
MTLTKKEKEYLDSWSLGVWVVSQGKEKALDYLLAFDGISFPNVIIPPMLETYKGLHEEDWGHPDAILSAFGI